MISFQIRYQGYTLDALKLRIPPPNKSHAKVGGSLKASKPLLNEKKMLYLNRLSLHRLFQIPALLLVHEHPRDACRCMQTERGMMGQDIMVKDFVSPQRVQTSLAT